MQCNTKFDKGSLVYTESVYKAHSSLAFHKQKPEKDEVLAFRFYIN